MNSNTHIIRACFVGLCCLLSQPALPADFKVNTVAGRLVMDIDANWDQVAEMPEGFEDAVGFRVGDGSTMQWLLAPGNEQARGMGTSGDMRDLTLALKEMVESEGGQVSGGLLPVEGPRAKGFYIKAVDPSPGPDEWKFMYTGWVAVDSHPVMFNIVWNAGGQSAADRALACIKSMRLQR